MCRRESSSSDRPIEAQEGTAVRSAPINIAYIEIYTIYSTYHQCGHIINVDRLVIGAYLEVGAYGGSIPMSSKVGAF